MSSNCFALEDEAGQISVHWPEIPRTGKYRASLDKDESLSLSEMIMQSYHSKGVASEQPEGPAAS